MLPALAGAQQVYRWVDAEGNVTYSDQPPPGREVDTVPLRITRTDDAEAQQSFERLTAGVEERAEQRRAGAAGGNTDTEAQRADQCSRARSTLARLESQGNARVIVRGEEGTSHWTPEQRLQRIDEMRAVIADHCS